MTRRYKTPSVSLHDSKCSSSETLPLYEESVSPPNPPTYDQIESSKSVAGSTSCTEEKQHCSANDEKRNLRNAGEGYLGGLSCAVNYGQINMTKGRSFITSGPSTQGRTVYSMRGGGNTVSGDSFSVSHGRNPTFNNGGNSSVIEGGTTGGLSDAKHIANDQAHCGHPPYGRLIGEPVVGHSMSGDVFDGTTMSGDTVLGKTMSGNTLYGETMSGNTVWGKTASGKILLPGQLTVMGVTKWPID